MADAIGIDAGSTRRNDLRTWLGLHALAEASCVSTNTDDQASLGTAEANVDVLQSLLTSLMTVDDPREPKGKRYLMLDVPTVAVLGCMCGCDDAEALQDYGTKERGWLLGFNTDEAQLPPVLQATTVGKGHGRIETRTVRVMTSFGGWVPSAKRWADLRCAIAIDLDEV